MDWNIGHLDYFLDHFFELFFLVHFLDHFIGGGGRPSEVREGWEADCYYLGRGGR